MIRSVGELGERPMMDAKIRIFFEKESLSEMKKMRNFTLL